MQGRRKWADALGCGTRIGLHVDAPDGGIKVECIERSFTTKIFEFVYPLITTVVPRIWETL